MEYRFRLRAKDGSLQLEHAESCKSDDNALAIARGILPRNDRQLRVEVWRGHDCIYNGVPTPWPFQRASVVASRVSHDSTDGEEPPRAA